MPQFTDIFDFAEQCSTKVLNKRQLENLIKAGAFDSIAPNRCQLLNSVDIIIKHCQVSQEEKESNQVSLFGGGEEQEIPKPQLKEAGEWSETEKLQKEFEAIGFFLTDHPLASYKKFISHLKPTYYNEFASKLGEEFREVRVIGIVAGKKFKISQKGRFGFVQLSDPEGSFEITIYDEDLIAKSREFLDNGSKIYALCDGKKESDDQFRLIAKSIRPLEDVLSRKNIDIEINIESDEDIENLKNKLDKIEEGNSIITLLVRLSEEKTARVKLGKGYNITPDNFSF